MGSDGSCIINNGSFDRPVRPDQVLVCFLFVVESEYTFFGFDFVPILTQNISLMLFLVRIYPKLALTLMTRTLLVNPGGNPKRGTVPEPVLREKIQSAALHHLYMLLRFGFFSRISLGDGPKMAYIFVQHGIFSLILVYAISN